MNFWDRNKELRRPTGRSTTCIFYFLNFRYYRLNSNLLDSTKSRDWPRLIGGQESNFKRRGQNGKLISEVFCFVLFCGNCRREIVGSGEAEAAGHA